MEDEQHSLPSALPKKILISLVVLVLIVAGIFLSKNKPVERNDLKITPTREIVAQLPKGLPFEQEALVTGMREFLDTSTTTPDGKYRNSLIHNSISTVEENYNLYKTYCSENGFSTLEKATDKTKFFSKFSCSNGSITIMISINPPLPSVVLNSKYNKEFLAKSAVSLNFLQ